MREIKAGGLTIRGTSTAGVRTSLHVPQLGVVLDAGIAHPSFAKEENIFLSHCHMDHVGALLALLGNRDLKRFHAPRIFTPVPVVEQVSSLVQTGFDLGTLKEQAQVIGLSDSEVAGVGKCAVKAFRTHHAVPSNGYLFSQTKKRLKSEFAGLPGPKLGELRRSGEEIHVEEDWERLAYITDTTSDVWASAPQIFDADVLIMECTFIDDKKTVADARHHGHIHLDEVAENAALFRNKHVVLMHFSARYDNDEIQTLVDEKLPADLRERVQLLLPEDEM